MVSARVRSRDCLVRGVTTPPHVGLDLINAASRLVLEPSLGDDLGLGTRARDARTIVYRSDLTETF